MMRPRFSHFLVLLLHFVFILAMAATRHLPTVTDDGFASDNLKGTVRNQNPQSLQINHNPDGVMGIEEKASKYKEMEKIGSSPPRCEHKCYGCMPCEPIQVPTTPKVMGPQYTNYEPEGWRCKCGPTFYSP